MITRGTLRVNPVADENHISYQTHEEIQNRECVILECEVGKPAWIAVKIPEDTDTPWHRIQTSVVKKIEEPDIGITLCCNPPIHINSVSIITENSIYVISHSRREERPVITKLC